MAKYRFRLLHGCHVVSVPTGETTREGVLICKDVTYRAGQNDIIETDQDLALHNGNRGIGGRMEPKFIPLDSFDRPILGGLHASETPEQRVSRLERELTEARRFTQSVEAASTAPGGLPSPGTPYTPLAPVMDPLARLDGLSLEELKKYAEAEEVDLKGAKTKAEVLKILKTLQPA